MNKYVLPEDISFDLSGKSLNARYKIMKSLTSISSHLNIVFNIFTLMGCRATSKLGGGEILITVFDSVQVFYILWGFLVINNNLATEHFNFLFFLLLFLTFNLPNNLISSHLRYVERSTRDSTP